MRKQLCAVLGAAVLYLTAASVPLFSLDVAEQPPRQFIGTSLFVLTSLIPDTGGFFYEVDYGYDLTEKDTLLAGVDVYQFTAPMSTGWTDDASYDGHVLSYGLIAGYQRFLWKGLFASQMANGLIMDYYDQRGEKVQSGLMLLLTTRAGWHWDLSLGGLSCYLEAAGEFNVWPVNTRVPSSFAELDDAYPVWVIAPALNWGIRF